MKWTPEIKQFVAEHQHDDSARLLLSAHRYPDVDVPFAVDQIEARRRLRFKLPEWYANADLIMGGRIPAEQCSSESTARYKHSLLEECRSLCDMTGGMGVDFWYMSQGMELAIYTECQPHLCEIARHNFEVLASSASVVGGTVRPAREIVVREGLSTEMPVPDVDVIYLDPARRSDAGSRIYEIEDCLPNVIAWQDELLRHCKRLIVKVSPMADLQRTLQRFKHVVSIHVVSVRNECKELLIVQDAATLRPDVEIRCIDFLASGEVNFCFKLAELAGASMVPIAADLSSVCCLYEPDVSLMKAQAFAPIAHRYPVRMLDVNTHLFVADKVIEGFPGRSFFIDEVIEFSSRQLKQLKKRVPQANLSVRNFPLSADELRARSGIRDGGDVYLFGSQTSALGTVLLLCHKQFG